MFRIALIVLCLAGVSFADRHYRRENYSHRYTPPCRQYIMQPIVHHRYIYRPYYAPYVVEILPPAPIIIERQPYVSFYFGF